MLALTAIQRARELFRVYAPKKLEKRLERLREAIRLTRAALQKAELGRAERAAGDFIEARRLVGDVLPPSKSSVLPLATSRSRAPSASIAGSAGR